MGDGEASVPGSPYTANRTTIRELTLPTVPNFDIPMSPPGSPSPRMNAKLDQFLELKKSGIHFNEKLAKSSALKNPSLLQKLIASAGVDSQEQYSSTLSKDLWDPAGFPPWAYKEDLAKSQQELTKEKEAKAPSQRDSIDFVPGTLTDRSAGRGIPASNSTRADSRVSAAERVMAGLNRDKRR